MIRWEQQASAEWQGLSGELPVATVIKDPDAEREQWVWKINGLKRPKGWRKPIGHRTTWLDARRSADAYWEKWLPAPPLPPGPPPPPPARPSAPAARRSADAYWEKWLAAASLRPDLQRLAMQSLPPEERPKSRRRKSTRARNRIAPPSWPERRATGLSHTREAGPCFVLAMYKCVSAWPQGRLWMCEVRSG